MNLTVTLMKMWVSVQQLCWFNYLNLQLFFFYSSSISIWNVECLFFKCWDRSLSLMKKLQWMLRTGLMSLYCNWLKNANVVEIQMFGLLNRERVKKRLVFPRRSTKKKKKQKVLSKLQEASKEKSPEQSSQSGQQDVPEDVEVERTVRKSTRTSVIVRQAERDAIRAALQATAKVSLRHVASACQWMRLSITVGLYLVPSPWISPILFRGLRIANLNCWV